MENINTALLLMAVGMTTVFCVLLIVIYLGKALIRIVNRRFPEPSPEKPPVEAAGQAISNRKIAAITAAVSAITQGRGQITRIEKQ